MHGTKFDKEDYLIFINEHNRYIKADQPRKVLKRVIESYNLKDSHIHGFRHTHCSLLFEAGVKMQVVKDRLGHSGITTTMNIYAHVTQEQRDQVANIFADFIANKTSA